MQYNFRDYDAQIKHLLSEGLSKTDIVAKILNTTESRRENKQVLAFRKYIERNRHRIESDYQGVYEATDRLNIDNKDVKHLWMKDNGASLFIKNPNYQEPQLREFEILKDLILEDIRNNAVKITAPKRVENKDSYLLVLDPADIHIGKLCSSFETGEDYNSQIAVQRVLEGVRGILQKCQGYNIDKILFVAGNDVLHVDSPRNETTSGTKQDTDAMWYDNYRTARKLYVDILTILLGVADVEFVYNPSNHDYVHGFFLCQTIEAQFAKCKNITFNVDMRHRKYFTYFNNLISTCHGDGAKVADLPILMAHEADTWSLCKHKYIYTHHVHHKIAKDYMGVCVESLRSPSGADSWHAKNGFIHSPKAIEAFLHHKLHGQCCRITHLF
jgi:hypothetical protein